MLCIPSVTRLYGAYSSKYIQVLTLRISDSWRISSIKAGCAWIKRTFQDMAMYSRIKYQFPGEFSVFQVVLTWRMPIFQPVACFFFFTPRTLLSWKVLLVPSGADLYQGSFLRYSKVFVQLISISWRNFFNTIKTRFIMCAFQDTARVLCMDSRFLCKISSLQRVWAWIERTFQVIIMFSSTEAQFLGDFSSTQAGRPHVKCASKI